MKEIITDIQEVESLRKDHTDYCGFYIETTKQTILLLISNGASCCENFGYLHSEDNLEDFVGAELLKVEKVDTKLEKTTLNDVDEGECIFINLETSKGTCQFAVYNSHNGYYGHSVFIEMNGVKEETGL